MVFTTNKGRQRTHHHIYVHYIQTRRKTTQHAQTQRDKSSKDLRSTARNRQCSFPPAPRAHHIYPTQAGSIKPFNNQSYKIYRCTFIHEPSLSHLCATVGDAEAGHDLVEHEQGAVLGAQVAAALEELGRGLDEAGVAHHGLEDDGGDVLVLDELLHAGEVVVGGHEGVLRRTLRHA